MRKKNLIYQKQVNKSVQCIEKYSIMDHHGVGIGGGDNI
jgi:hypothetical protein